MAGPWEQYAPQAAPQSGPWARYAAPVEQGKGELGYAPAPPEPTPQAAQADPGILENARSGLQGAEMAVRDYLRPGPDDNSLLSFGKKLAMSTAVTGTRLAQIPVNALIAGFNQGPQASQVVDPETGAFSPQVSPEAIAALQLVAGGGMRMGPLERPPVGRSLVKGVEPVDPALAASAAGRQAELSAPATPTPTNFTVDTAKPPTTAAGAKEVAGAYYDVADKAGGTLQPSVTNAFIDAVTSKLPQTEAGKAVLGQSPTMGLVDRLQQLRGQPLTLKAAQEIDEGLGNLIDKEYGVKGLSKEGANLASIQRDFRGQIENAGPDDVTGGTAGFDALAPARQAWSQAMKLGDLERIQTRAENTDNPVTSIRAQLRALLSNPARMRGYSPDEVAALQSAADRGVLGGALHVFGSRLIPIGALSHGILAAGVSHLGTSALRGVAERLASGRLGNAAEVLGQGVPPMPGAPPRAALPAPPPNSLLRYVPPLLLGGINQRDDAAVRP